jgi:hypothetical protein
MAVPLNWSDIDLRRRHFRQSDRTAASVYFVEAQGLVKIGATVRDPHRAVALMTTLSDDRRLLAVMPNAGERRRQELQRMFASQRLGGDWFERSPELDAVIRAFAV